MNIDNTSNGSWTVYMHTNIYNGKKYVGITSRAPKDRWRNGDGYRSGYFRSAIDKYGWDGFSHEILFTGLTECQAKKKEVELISLYNSNQREYGYNLTRGGDGVLGMVHTNETRERMSESHIGHVHSDATKEKISTASKGNKKWLGKHHTEETKLKMSNARIAYYEEHPVTDVERLDRAVRAKEAYEKNPNLRVTLSQRRKKYFIDNPDAKIEMSLRQSEYYRNHPEALKKLSDEHKKQVEMIDASGAIIKIFSGMTDAQIETGVDRSSIARVCNGKQKTAGGYIWRYHIEQNN